MSAHSAQEDDKVVFLKKCVHLGRQVAVVAGGGQRGEAEARLAAGEGGRRLDERRSVSEGAEASLLRQELLVSHGVDGMWEREGRAAESETWRPESHQTRETCFIMFFLLGLDFQ